VASGDVFETFTPYQQTRILRMLCLFMNWFDVSYKGRIDRDAVFERITTWVDSYSIHSADGTHVPLHKLLARVEFGKTVLAAGRPTVSLDAAVDGLVQTGPSPVFVITKFVNENGVSLP